MFFSGSALPGRMSAVLTGHDRVADLHACRLQHVSLFPVGVSDERDPRRSVRVVFDRRDGRRNVALVALEINDAVHPLVTAATPPRGELTAVVPPPRPMQRLDERLVRFLRRDLVEHLHRLKPLAGRRRIEFTYRHDYAPSRNSGIFAPSADARTPSSNPAAGPRSDPAASPCRARYWSARCRLSIRAASRLRA